MSMRSRPTLSFLCFCPPCSGSKGCITMACNNTYHSLRSCDKIILKLIFKAFKRRFCFSFFILALLSLPQTSNALGCRYKVFGAMSLIGWQETSIQMSSDWNDVLFANKMWGLGALTAGSMTAQGSRHLPVSSREPSWAVLLFKSCSSELFPSLSLQA